MGCAWENTVPDPCVQEELASIHALHVQCSGWIWRYLPHSWVGIHTYTYGEVFLAFLCPRGFSCFQREHFLHNTRFWSVCHLGFVRNLLRNPEIQRDPSRYRIVVQKVIAFMTQGIDVSRLFSEMIMVCTLCATCAVV